MIIVKVVNDAKIEKVITLVLSTTIIQTQKKQNQRTQNQPRPFKTHVGQGRLEIVYQNN
jgi:hypothetical protein